jgi:hypothetical protein
MMSGVCQVTGELAVGLGMAFLACFHNSVESHMGIRIVDLPDIVRSMAVGTFCGLMIAQGVSLTVDGFSVGFGQLFMAGSALVCDFRHELVLIDMPHLVGGMAVITIGQPFLNIRIFDIVDALYIILINPLMAGRARGGYILVICGGAVIFMIEDKMRAVTVCAYSAWEQSFFGQAFSMNAAGIVHNHISHLGFQSGGVA